MALKTHIWILLVLMIAGCTHAPRRFPRSPPLWEDPDRNHVPTEPAEFYSGLYADAIDQTFFRPFSEVLALPAPGESVNVNSHDGVPDSSWFENRIGLHPMTPEEAARGSCSQPPLDPETGPWIITKAKTEGITPGLFIRAPDGHTYLLKFDTSFRPQRGTAADVIGSKIYHAAGYRVPCNQIVYFRSDVLRLGPDATKKDELGRKQPMTQPDVEELLRQAFRLKNGLLRASASRFLPGKPLGPHPLVGVRADDPNDVVSHEDRRELRASRLLAAWLHHFDIREQNSLDMWVEEDGRRFVRHHEIDFGDSFGTPWEDDRLNRRVGHSYYFDWEHILLDLFTFGVIPRPWYRNRINDEAAIFGYYGWKDFVPSKWRPVYPNPAFSRMTYRDALWMVRIIVRFTDEHLAAIVKTGRFTNPRHESYLLEALIRRRDKIAGEYLQKYVPLDSFRLVRRNPEKPDQSLCFEDLGIRHAGVDATEVVYKLRMMGGDKLDRELGWLQFQPDPDHPDRSCVLLPVGDQRPGDLAPDGAPDDHPRRYSVLKIAVFRRPALPPTHIDIHLYDLGVDRGFILAGIDRPPAE